LVDRIFDYVVELCPEIKADRVAELKQAARAEFSGERCYINERSPTDRQQLVAEVLALFNGRNATEIARRLSISRSTVYRYIKQAGKTTAN
ncbi:MAG: HTH domain-containing protein, partial [Rubrivivax sp.]